SWSVRGTLPFRNAHGFATACLFFAIRGLFVRNTAAPLCPGIPSNINQFTMMTRNRNITVYMIRLSRKDRRVIQNRKIARNHLFEACPCRGRDFDPDKERRTEPRSVV